MNQAIDAKKRSIGELLGRYERRPVVLPPFQRSYSWEKSHISTFWGDLMAFNVRFSKDSVTASYFLGPIVILNSEREITLLDGQQRLATATILLAVLRDTARNIDTGRSHKGADFARDIQRELLEKDSDPATFSLRLNELDEPFFLRRITNDPSVEDKARLRSHKLIEGAYIFFSTEIKKSVGGKPPDDALKMLKSIKDALTTGMSLVAITVQDEEDAYNIFETLNDRGLRLSVPDLVVNLLMRRSPDKATRQIVRKKWNEMIQQMGRRDISRFLRHMWLSKYGDLKAKGLYSEIKGFLEGKGLSSLDFSETCASECDDYVALLDVSKGLPPNAIPNLEGMVRYLGVNNSLPLLLSGYRCLSQGDFEKLVKAVVMLYVRHTLVANQNPLDLETVFYEAAREIRAKHEASSSSSKCLKAAKAILMKLNPTDALVDENAKDLILQSSEATWLLTQLANALQSKTKEVGMDRANVEHIFPQNAGPAWPNRARLEPYLWHLGNLTILGRRLNNKAKNKAFKDKCHEQYRKSEIEMTKELLKVSDWNETEIKNRAARLAKLIVQVWH